MTPQEFYSQYLPHAEKVSNQTGLDPRLVLAQAALETGYGKSAPNMNFFGIKSHGKKGGQTLQTSEFEGGKMVGQPASFRGYGSPDQSFQDYANFLKSNPRYEGVLSAKGLDGQIAAMADSGYATDPDYGAKLANIAGKFDPSSAPIIASDTMRVLGKQQNGLLGTAQAANNTESKMIPEEKPRGLLGSLGIQKMEEGAEGEAGQRFFQRDTFKDTAANLAQGFAAMGSSPALQKMTADVASQRTESKAKNKTMEYLRANGRGDLADAVESGSLGIRDAAVIMFGKPKDDRTALMQNYEYAVSKGMSPEEARTWVSSGNTTNINTGEKGANKFEELDAQALADVSKTAMAAGRSLGQIDRLESLLSGVDTGMAASMQSLAGSFGIKTENLGDIQAAEALISALVPQQRTPGSGPMSDADLDLFKKSLPRLINTPGGNAMILQTMRGLAQYDALGGEIVQRYRSKEITQAEAFAQLQARQDPFVQFRSVVGGGQGAGMDRGAATELLLNSGGDK